MTRRVPWLAVALVLALPASAQAHAVLERTVPERGAGLERQPGSVGFYFSEPVEASFGAVRVFDSQGDQVESGEIFRPRARSDAVAVRLDPDLADGTYTATYRVISADSHPVSGGFVFTIGEPGTGASRTVSELLNEGDAGAVMSAAFWADRWLGYAAIGVAVGVLVFLFAVWPAALGRVAGGGAAWIEASAAFAGRARWLVVGAIGAGLLAGLAALPLQGATASGTSFWGALDSGVLGDVLETRFGTITALRLAAWAVLAGLLAAALGRAWRPATLRPVRLGATGAVQAPGPGRVAAALLALPLAVLVVSPSLSGHASTQSPEALLLPANILHVGAMSVWFGGLAALVVALPAATRRLDPAARTTLLWATLARFSPFALAAVVVLAATGTAQAIVEVGSFGALIDTGFGRAVLIKVALLLALIALGAANRQRLIPALRRLVGASERPGAPGRGARRNLRTEVALIAVVLGVTAALVSYAPASETDAGPISGRTTIGPAALEYTVDPAEVGRNEVHLYLFDAEDGSQYRDVEELRVHLSLPDADIAPIETDVRTAGPGHYVAPSAPFGVAGDWRMEVAMRVSRFEEGRADVQVPIE
ncbi:MAG: copper resistance CopC/CopD family protein [Solirubrobacterales bacterium]